MGRDSNPVQMCTGNFNISTHTPAWGVTHEPSASVLPFVHFNSHARVGRDPDFVLRTTLPQISTHTPAWGVTVLHLIYSVANYISTHTPAWGVTLVQLCFAPDL